MMKKLKVWGKKIGMKNKEIKIRGVEEDILNRIDLRYKREGYKSRNEFLMQKIIEIALEKEEEKIVKKELRKREIVLKLIDFNTKVLAEFLKLNGLSIDDLYTNPNLNIADYEYDFLGKIEKFEDDEKEIIGTEEIKIRNIRSVVLKRIDYLCKKSRFKNRSEFLVNLLENFVIRNEIKDIKIDEEYKTKKFEKILELNTEAINNFIEVCTVDVSKFYDDYFE